jgi:hypothetical protein
MNLVLHLIEIRHEFAPRNEYRLLQDGRAFGTADELLGAQNFEYFAGRQREADRMRTNVSGGFLALCPAAETANRNAMGRERAQRFALATLRAPSLVPDNRLRRRVFLRLDTEVADVEGMRIGVGTLYRLGYCW